MGAALRMKFRLFEVMMPPQFIVRLRDSAEPSAYLSHACRQGMEIYLASNLVPWMASSSQGVVSRCAVTLAIPVAAVNPGTETAGIRNADNAEQAATS